MVTTQVPAPRRRRGGREGTVSGATAVNVVLVVATIYFLLPLVWVLVAATKSPGDLFSSFGLWFSDSPRGGLGERRIEVGEGEAAEFSTMTPHAMTALDAPAELVMVFDREGQRAHLHR